MNLHLCGCVLFFLFVCFALCQPHSYKIWTSLPTDLYLSANLCIKQKKDNNQTSLYSSVFALCAYLGMYIYDWTRFCYMFSLCRILRAGKSGVLFVLLCLLLCSAPCLLWSGCYFLCVISLATQSLSFYYNSVYL